MAKLYPPILGGTIPACVFKTETISGQMILDNSVQRYKNGSIESTPKLIIPFTNNRAMSITDNIKIVLKIKDIDTNKERPGDYIQSKNSVYISAAINHIKDNQYEAIFNNIPVEDAAFFTLKTGRYYKIQIAYMSNNIIGYFSNVSIIKCTTLPDIQLIGSITYKRYIAEIAYQQSNDMQEMIYKYKFDLLKDDKILETSGWIVQNRNKDQFNFDDNNKIISHFCINSYGFNRIDSGATIQYSVITQNGLQLLYFINDGTDKIPLSDDTSFNASYIFNDGSVKLNISCSNNNKYRAYIIKRQEKGKPETLKNLKPVILDRISNFSWYDQTVEQGKEYQYFLQEIIKIKDNYNTTFYNLSAVPSSDKWINIYTDFEDLFLSDKDKQLNIKFNPKVSSFKTVKVDNKTDPIGTQYPNIFHNDIINYKELNIQGLISYQIDENNLFISKEKLGLAADNNRQSTANTDTTNILNPTANLVDYNIEAEKRFKLAVLDWLNNGQPKLFRSAAEGNYIIRLTNINMSPEDQLGRMLHSFSATGYEIAEASVEKLKEYHILEQEDNIVDYNRIEVYP